MRAKTQISTTRTGTTKTGRAEPGTALPGRTQIGAMPASRTQDDRMQAARTQPHTTQTSIKQAPGTPADETLTVRMRAGRTHGGGRSRLGTTVVRTGKQTGGKIQRLKTILSQALIIIFLIMFCLSFERDISVPAFTGEGPQVDDGPLLSPSVFDILWQRRGISKILLKTGFPMISYMEEIRKDYPMLSIPLQIFGWFLGFTPRGVQDVVASSFPKFVDDYMVVWSGGSADDPEKDWGVSPVLFSLPPGDGVIPATMISRNSPVVAVYHTHATESYLPELNKTKGSEAFSSDLTKTVVKVGEMLAEELERTYRLPVLHSKTVHDAESRVGAYYRSEATVTAIREKYPDCKILLDIHRDSQPRSLTAVTIGGKPYARMLLVVGTENPNWVSNYNFSRQLIAKLDERYPGITRGILHASAVYNQKYSPLAILVEVGGVDNTLAECKHSMQALAWALASVITGSD
ncbi:MAG: stage II sporulation protein P [Firmicutes bacterium]|nr:stage II sporulation protein P [Candidatus Fermentithermobacillaceae bacterium]